MACERGTRSLSGQDNPAGQTRGARKKRPDQLRGTSRKRNKKEMLFFRRFQKHSPTSSAPSTTLYNTPIKPETRSGCVSYTKNLM